MHKIIVVDPGHFHAGLVFRNVNSQIDPEINLYAENEADAEDFCRLVESFNQRAESPANWRIVSYYGKDFLVRAAAEKKGDIAVLAGKNDRKIDYIDVLTAAGFNVLADKPVIINSDDLIKLEKILKRRPLTLDIMTERYEIHSILQKLLANSGEIFGTAQKIDITSVHNLYKMVNHKVLRRPVWYFDTDIQGEGLTDVSTHFIDLVLWGVFENQDLDFERDCRIISRKSYPTLVTADKFELITGEKICGDFDLNCNGVLDFELKNLPVKVEIIWNLTSESGDLFNSIYYGSKSTLVLHQNASSGNRMELEIIPENGINSEFIDKLKAILIAKNYSDVNLKHDDGKLFLDIPERYKLSHEQHFALVLADFMKKLDASDSAKEERNRLFLKEQILN